MKRLFILFILTLVLNSFCEELDSLAVKREVKYILQGASVVAEKETQAVGKVETITLPEDTPQVEMDVSEIVDNAAGLQLNRGGKSGSELSIRGFEKEDITIMVDGRPMGGGYFDAVDLSSLPAGEIKEIQVLKGPVSSLYGSNTMGGVVNIVTRKPEKDKWLKTSLQLRRNNTARLRLTSMHSFRDYDYLISAGFYNTDGFSLSDDFKPHGLENGGLRDNTARRQYNAETRVNYHLTDFHQVGLTASLTYMDFREIPVATDEYYNPDYPDDIFRKFVDWKRYQASAYSNWLLNWNQRLNLNLYYDGYDDIYQTFRDPEYTIKALDSRLLSSNLGLIAKYTYESSGFDFLAGYRGERQAYNRKDNQGYSQWTGNWQYLHNPFLQMEKDLADIKVTAGCGFSLFHQNGRENPIYHLEPSLGINYKHHLLGTHNLAFSNNVNYPALHELFSASSGNPELKEESAWKFEYSADYPFRLSNTPVVWNVSFFYNSISDLVDKAQVTPTSSQYINIDHVNSYGIESLLKISDFSSEYINSEFSLSYRYLDYTSDSQRPLHENPRYIVRLKEILYFNGNLNFEYDLSWHDSAVSENHTLSAYWLHNLYLSWSIDSYRLKFGLENILDANYQDKYGYPQPGRDYLITLEADLL